MRNRYGVTGRTAETAFGVGMGTIQTVTKAVRSPDPKQNHALAGQLWESEQYDARMVASMLDDPALVTPSQMDRWAKDFDNWAICDTVCFKLFDQVEPDLGFAKVRAWSSSKHEFVKRAAFALLASMALHRKALGDECFLESLPLVEQGAADGRNFVKKGVSWALRSVGRHSPRLRSESIALAERLAASVDAAPRWVGKDALRDLSRAKR